MLTLRERGIADSYALLGGYAGWVDAGRHLRTGSEER